MIKRLYSSECDAPDAWGNPTGETIEHTKLGPSFFASGRDEARRELARLGWYVADSGQTYCPFHAENARRLDHIVRENARAL